MSSTYLDPIYFTNHNTLISIFASACFATSLVEPATAVSLRALVSYFIHQSIVFHRSTFSTSSIFGEFFLAYHIEDIFSSCADFPVTVTSVLGAFLTNTTVNFPVGWAATAKQVLFNAVHCCRLLTVNLQCQGKLIKCSGIDSCTKGVLFPRYQ